MNTFAVLYHVCCFSAEICYNALSFYFLDSDLRRDDSIDEIEVTLIRILFFHFYRSVGDDSPIFFF